MLKDDVLTLDGYWKDSWGYAKLIFRKNRAERQRDEQRDLKEMVSMACDSNGDNSSLKLSCI